MRGDLFLGIVGAGLVLSGSAQASELIVGISPSAIYADSLLPGSHYEQNFLFSTNGGAELLVDIILPDGIKSWVSTRPEFPFFLNESINSAEFSISIDVPDNAHMGHYEYSGGISATPQQWSGNFKTGIVLPLMLSLEVIDLKFSKIEIARATIPAFSEKERLRLVLDAKNKGNAPGGPDKAVIKIKDPYDEGLVQEITLQLNTEIAPFKREIIELSADHNASPGQYLSLLSIYEGGSALLDQIVMIEVLPAPKTGNSVGFFASLAGLSAAIAAGYWLSKKTGGSSK